MKPNLLYTNEGQEIWLLHTSNKNNYTCNSIYSNKNMFLNLYFLWILFLILTIYLWSSRYIKIHIQHELFNSYLSMYKTRFNIPPLYVWLFERYTRYVFFLTSTPGKHFDWCIRYFGGCCAVNLCKLFLVHMYSLRTIILTYYFLESCILCCVCLKKCSRKLTIM